LEAVVGNLPNYADTPNTKWICHRYFWWNVMERLARAAGGVTAAEVRGPAARSCLGYPVEISQVFPKTDANSQILCTFGDHTLAATLGDRRETVISISDQAYWANDQIGIKGTERFDINVHDVGTATVAGPVVALQSLNS
jgi:HK97 family phage major capsid protein